MGSGVPTSSPPVDGVNVSGGSEGKSMMMSVGGGDVGPSAVWFGDSVVSSAVTRVLVIAEIPSESHTHSSNVEHILIVIYNKIEVLIIMQVSPFFPSLQRHHCEKC